MVLKITKETWEKCGIKIIKHYTKKEDMIELWQKMRGVELLTNHTNIYDLALKRIRKYCGKKNKRHYRRRKRKI